MSDGLDVIIIDDEPQVCDVLADMIRKFYVWGEIRCFTDVDQAIVYCLQQDVGVGIFVLDMFIGDKNGFNFLDAIEGKYPSASQDTIMITGKASNDVVDMCVASEVNYLLEKPIKPYALQLAVRSIVTKYLTFAKRLLTDPLLAECIERM